jgi:hypothetical protein
VWQFASLTECFVIVARRTPLWVVTEIAERLYVSEPRSRGTSTTSSPRPVCATGPCSQSLNPRHAEPEKLHGLLHIGHAPVEWLRGADKKIAALTCADAAARVDCVVSSPSCCRCREVNQLISLGYSLSRVSESRGLRHPPRRRQGRRDPRVAPPARGPPPPERANLASDLGTGSSSRP